MSLKLKNIHVGKWIAGWRLDKVFAGLAEGDTDVLKQAGAYAVVALDKLRAQAKNPTADLILKAISEITDIPEELRNVLVDKIIPTLIRKEAELSPCLDAASVDEQVACLFNEFIPQKEEGDRASFWNTFAAKIAHELILVISGKPIDWTDIFALVPLAFKKLFKK